MTTTNGHPSARDGWMDGRTDARVKGCIHGCISSIYATYGYDDEYIYKGQVIMSPNPTEVVIN